jgi:hypothetical protein
MAKRTYHSRWAEVTDKYPEASAGAKLFICERLELADLDKYKKWPLRALILLRESIKRGADQLIQAGVKA